MRSDAIRGAGDPRQIDRAIELLAGAERPLVACGRRRLLVGRRRPSSSSSSSSTGIPAYARRAGQGAIPEDHPLAIRGSWKKPFTGRADVVLAIGFDFWSGEHFGQPPTWNDKTKVHPGRCYAARASASTCRPRSRSSAIRSSSSASSIDAAGRAGLDASIAENRSGTARSPRCARTTRRRIDERERAHARRRTDPSRSPARATFAR